jgi:hypothetical protein
MTPEIGRAEGLQRTETALYMQAWERRGCRVRFLTHKRGEVLLSGWDWCQALGVPYPRSWSSSIASRAAHSNWRGSGGGGWISPLNTRARPTPFWLIDRVVEMPEPPADFLSAYALIVAPQRVQLWWDPSRDRNASSAPADGGMAVDRPAGG